MSRRYRKKPVVIEAMQYRIGNLPQIIAWLGGSHTVSYDDDSEIFIRTLEGVMHASVNDWIIKGVKGEFYPCKPDLFEATYEEA